MLPLSDEKVEEACADGWLGDGKGGMLIWDTAKCIQRQQHSLRGVLFCSYKNTPTRKVKLLSTVWNPPSPSRFLMFI